MLLYLGLIMLCELACHVCQQQPLEAGCLSPLPQLQPSAGPSAHLLGHKQEFKGGRRGGRTFLMPLPSSVRMSGPLSLLTLCVFITLANVARFSCCLFHSRFFCGGGEMTQEGWLAFITLGWFLLYLTKETNRLGESQSFTHFSFYSVYQFLRHLLTLATRNQERGK